MEVASVKTQSLKAYPASVPHFPAEDEKIRASTLSQRRGGNAPNTLEVLSQLIPIHPAASPESRQDRTDQDGAVAESTGRDSRQDLGQTPSLALLAVLPDFQSTASQTILNSLGSSIETTACIFRNGIQEAAASYIIRNQASDSRTCVNYNALPEMTLAEFAQSIEHLHQLPDWVHFEGRIPDVSVECIRHLRRRHPAIRISVELEKPARPGLQALVPEADVVFFARSWAMGQGYDSAEACLLAQANHAKLASLLVCTWGAQGASALSLDAGRLISSPAFGAETGPVVDSIGAGDTFIAGMLFALMYHETDWTLERKVAFANELAGRKVRQEGFAGLGKQVQHWHP